MIGLMFDYVRAYLKYRFRRKKKMRFPNGIPRVVTPEQNGREHG